MTASKLVLSAASGVGGSDAVNVEDVFSTYLYEGNSSAQTITNGIDLDGEGGLVWIKNREQADDHYLGDSERGFSKRLESNNTNAQTNNANGTWSFNANGFSIPNFTQVNTNGENYASWTFRKAEKFFDVVTYTGTGSYQGGISHNLGTTPGMIIVKRTDSTGDWVVWHRGADPKNLQLNATSSASTEYAIQDVTSTTFGVTNYTTLKASESGATYVAYLFAHNNGDGEFGPDGDQDIIKCGSYTGDNSTSSNFIDLGFEPQFVLIKSSSNGSHWVLFDTMRGITTDDSAIDPYLRPHLSNTEVSSGARLNVNSQGFTPQTTNSDVNRSGYTYVYMAIRRGPMAVPESGTDVFDVAFDGALDTNKPYIRSDLNYVDMVINSSRTGTTYHRVGSRLTQGTYLDTNSTSAETTSSYYQYDFQNGWFDLAASNSINTNGISWMWKRAPNYFDVVAYTGNGTAGRTVSHNLGVAPEMIWVKVRSTTGSWRVYTQPTGNTGTLRLDSTSAFATGSTYWNNTDPSSTEFTVGTANGVNQNGQNFIAYLFASLDGVSKVGSYTGNGTAGHQIDCGFTNGARFVLIKSTSSGRSWIVHDTERGIVAGNDPFLKLDTTDAEQSDFDVVDAYSSGFIVNEYSNWNASGETYIFYAIA